MRGTVEALIALLKDQNPETRRPVAPILGSLGQALARARSALSAALRDANREVRLSATRALAAMGSVVTATVAALRSAGERENDDETGDAIWKARRLIEDALSAREAPKKWPDHHTSPTEADREGGSRNGTGGARSDLEAPLELGLAFNRADRG